MQTLFHIAVYCIVGLLCVPSLVVPSLLGFLCGSKPLYFLVRYMRFSEEEGLACDDKA